MIVELSQIDKTYNPKTYPVPVLKNVSLSVAAGDYLAIMGPSGSGKSTLMNIIGCLDRPTGGTYRFDGEDVGRLSENRLAEFRAHRIGFVFQTFELLKEETALYNVMLPLSFAGVRYSERKEIAAAALAKVGLEDRMNFLPSQLSGGQKQRVAIARAIVNNPSLLLADEPTGALDQRSGAQIMELFQRIHAEGTTIIMITHDAKIAARAAHTIYIVDGRVYTTAADADAAERAIAAETEDDATDSADARDAAAGEAPDAGADRASDREAPDGGADRAADEEADTQADRKGGGADGIETK